MPIHHPELELMHLRYKARHKHFAGCNPCPAFDLFDWVIWRPNGKFAQRFKKLRPAKVLCLAHPKSIGILCKLKFLLKDVVLVIGGEDTRLSQALPQIELLKKHCRRVYFEAMDVDCAGVHTFSMGFISFYLKRMGGDVITSALTALSSEGFEKNGILAAWGAIYRQLDELIEERASAAKFIESSGWLVREQLDPEAYINRLATAKYLLAPSGNGVQAPKLAEAWLMRTVPIVIKNPCFEGLSAMGYPFVLINDWSELSPELLENHEPCRLSIDWDRVQNMLTLEFFRKEILQGS